MNQKDIEHCFKYAAIGMDLYLHSRDSLSEFDDKLGHKVERLHLVKYLARKCAPNDVEVFIESHDLDYFNLIFNDTESRVNFGDEVVFLKVLESNFHDSDIEGVLLLGQHQSKVFSNVDANQAKAYLCKGGENPDDGKPDLKIRYYNIIIPDTFIRSEPFDCLWIG